MGDAALHYYRFGLEVIPIAPGAKQSAVQWDGWLNKLSETSIQAHWKRYPTDDLGFIVGERLVVLDTDTAEATEALYDLERGHGVEPRFVVSTSRGEHHYFNLADGVVARTDTHSGKLYPERIDVKAGRSMVNLPPSGVRKIKSCSVQKVGELSQVSQEFVDAVFAHNGRPPPRLAPERERVEVHVDDAHLAKVGALLDVIDPNCGYADWTQVLMAVFHESQGSDEGLALADAWSAKGEEYPGGRTVEAKWKSFSLDVANPLTIGTLIKRARDGGADVEAIFDDAFEVTATPTEVVYPHAANATPLDRYALPPDAMDQLSQELVDDVFVLGRLAKLGQSTFFFAAPGTGKTLLLLHLLLESFLSGRLGKVKVYYVNLDDSIRGVVEKFPILAEHGLSMLVDGRNGFSAEMLMSILDQMANDGSARNAVVIVDTAKKIVNVMDKKESSRFMLAVRRFGQRGGTFIGLAHTNKHLDANGNPVAGGTSDIRDDADCTYNLRELEGGQDTGEKLVEFVNTKRRGNNVLTAAYAYTLDRDISYADLLLSVRELEPDHTSIAKLNAKGASEAVVIEAIGVCIAEGINKKMELATEVKTRTGVSRKAAGDIITRYTGDDPELHRWRFDVGAHGAHVYRLMTSPPLDPSSE